MLAQDLSEKQKESYDFIVIGHLYRRFTLHGSFLALVLIMHLCQAKNRLDESR